jgi:predicted porin
MIRGFMKTTSRSALLAAAGILMGSYVYSPAKAADLGGGSCCGDLEERVAELEATTARKGNRVVSLQIYGQVNRGLLIWDDGTDSDAYVVDNDASSTRFGMTGKAAMKPGWTAGYNIEVEIQDAASDEVDQVFDDVGAAATASSVASELVRIRLANWYLESERLGRLTLGQASTASDGITEIALHNQAGKTIGAVGLVRTFGVRGADELAAADARWGDIASNLAGLGRNDIIRYDTPSLHGFIVSASWGDDDLFDIAVRFKKEWNSIRIAAGIAYAHDGTVDFTTDYDLIGGSLAAMHIPTGIFGQFSIGQKEYKDVRENAEYWAVQFGVERKWLPYGTTTIYGEYASYEGDFDNRSGVVAAAADPNAFDGSEATKWGLSVVQNFDKAALDLYAHAEFWDSEGIPLVTDDGELTVVMLGSRIKF